MSAARARRAKAQAARSRARARSAAPAAAPPPRRGAGAAAPRRRTRATGSAASCSSCPTPCATPASRCGTSRAAAAARSGSCSRTSTSSSASARRRSRPDDFLDLYVEGDRVYVALHQSFSRPPRFTESEAAALAAAARALGGEGRERAVKALRDSVPRDRRASFDELVGRIYAGAPPARDSVLGRLQRAIAERRAVRLAYHSASRDGGDASASVHPYTLAQRFGHWYLYGLDPARGRPLAFRLDRVRECAVTDRAVRAARRGGARARPALLGAAGRAGPNPRRAERRGLGALARRASSSWSGPSAAARWWRWPARARSGRPASRSRSAATPR